MLNIVKNTPTYNFYTLTTLIYGCSKIGKSTWCSQADNALFLSTEPGLNSLAVSHVPILSWSDLAHACADIAKGDHEFSTIIIDTIDNAYKLCSEFICKKYGIDHESDMPYGKGHLLINNEFQRVVTKLASLPYGLILVSHAQDKETETKLYGKRCRTVPTLPTRARDMITSFVDLILYVDIDRSSNELKRIIRTKPSLDYDAGDRTNLLPDTIGLDFKEFISYFDKNKKADEVASKNETIMSTVNAG